MWKYKVLEWEGTLCGSEELEDTLNTLGEEEWELINVIPQNTINNTGTAFNTLIFKKREN
ncbi:DUF4177 domain-containing protein [Clostridium hydrogeniformans]|uniref:DUF4177 domain-containing protein n=1 Tax=Clostridium hydrogeniformans TaxID=349933 RepID=UPI00054F8601|nr:DUF4177 domain-containing protein [Clostridium hydrogeniformans]